jgi:hypothetical protein
VKIALIILSGHEIDVIMGMSWMKLHKVHPCMEKSLCTFQQFFCIKASSHHVVEKRLEEIHMVLRVPRCLSG